jgi:hypothetical protein
MAQADGDEGVVDGGVARLVVVGLVGFVRVVVELPGCWAKKRSTDGLVGRRGIFIPFLACSSYAYPCGEGKKGGVREWVRYFKRAESDGDELQAENER